MRFTINLDKIKKVVISLGRFKKIILIIFISLLTIYITIRSIILVIDYNERNKPKPNVEETEKSYT